MADELEASSSGSSGAESVTTPMASQKCCSSADSVSAYGRGEQCSNGNAGAPAVGQDDLLQTMPDVVMQCIFETFDLRERCLASQVCQRWHYLLTCRFPMEDVTVLNIFQNNIYTEKISNNKNIGLKCYHVREPELLLTVLQHCHSVSSVKIWFWSTRFAGEVLRMLKEMSVKMRCLDLYPYREETALDLASSAFPELTGMTMRPHGQDYFWKGLDLTSFPNFEKLDTLMLDGFNIKSEVYLPVSLTTLEWVNRTGRFVEIMPKLKSLVNLEYLLLGHAEFVNANDFDDLLTTIATDHLPRLQYLIFRYCRIDTPKFGANGSQQREGDEASLARALNALRFSTLDISLRSLQMIKLDLCYGDLNYIVRKMLPFTGSNLRAVSLNVISEETDFIHIYELSEVLNERKLMLHFGLLQKELRSDRKIDSARLGVPPSSFGNVLARFEASFVSDDVLLKALLLSNPLPKLSDAKFIQSSAVCNAILFHLATFTPRLRKLSLINCSEENLDEGLVHFVSGFPARNSKSLQVIWKRRRNRPAAFYLQLVNDHSELIRGYGARFFSKKFTANKDGERITIWDKKSKKALFIQDFDVNDQGRIIGVVMPHGFDGQQNFRQNGYAQIELPVPP